MDWSKKRRSWLTDTPFEAAFLEGWNGIVSNLFEAIDAEMAKFPDVRMTITNLKEKNGSLYFTYERNHEPSGRRMALLCLTAEATYLSLRRCEICGQPGRPREYRHLYLTRCDEHAPKGSKIWSRS